MTESKNQRGTLGGDYLSPNVEGQSDQPLCGLQKGQGRFDRLKDAIEKTKSTIAVVTDHKSTKEVVEWTKKAGAGLMDHAAELGDDVLHSDLGKAAAKGAAIGAVAAVPIPLVGPIAGAIVGAGVGGYLSIKHGVGRAPDAVNADQEIVIAERAQSTEGVIADLKKLNELRQTGILSDAEFQEQKAKLLKRI